MNFHKIQNKLNILWVKYRQKLRFLGFLKLFRKIPTLIWATFAVIGILIVGVSIGLSFAYSTTIARPTEYETLTNTNTKYLDVIRGYETISNLYYSQGQSVSILLGSNKLLQNPALIEQILTNIKNTRDLILVQEGRMLELRKNAGLPNVEPQKAL